jgi:RNA polymerase sigma-70 factor (ECF subfamily)
MLAAACLRGEERAHAELDALLEQCRGVAARVDVNGAFVDDVLQHVRCLLIAPEVAGTSALAGYRGDGPLLAWLRTLVVRTALKQRERLHRHPPSEEAALVERAGHRVSPELDSLKQRYREAYQQAFLGAMQSLTARERTLLRMRYVDGLTDLAVARWYRVHRTTAMRWLSATEQKLGALLRAALAEKAAVSSSELESLLRAVQSDVGISLRTALKPGR